MNIYGVIILAALIGRFVVDLISELLNARSLTMELPEEARNLYDAQRYRRSQQYTATRSKFHLFESAFGLAVLLLFWFGGGFNRFDFIVRSWEFSPVLTGVLYIGILVMATDLLAIPFSLYSTFVIEERFGFNRTTPATFLTDRLKTLFLLTILGAPLLAAILWFFQYAGSWAWLYCWIVASLFVLVVQFVAPAWIMPLFNKFIPLQNGKLKDAISDYARTVNFSFKDIFVVDGSRRSTKPNAFFAGFGKSKRIALFDTLVAENSVPEIVAVLAHEVGHYQMKHVLKMMALSFVHLGLVLYLLSFFITSKGLFSAFFMDHISIYAGLLFFGLLFEPISFALSILLHLFSRKHELQADRYAVETTENSEHVISALKKLSVKSLSNLTPHPFYVFLNYSHPPLLNRVRAIQNLPSGTH